MTGTRRTPNGVDWAAAAAAIDHMRELARAAVAGLVADGFTDEQARAMVSGVFTSRKDGDQ